MFVIEQAAVTQAKAKIALVGIAGTGKTYTGLVIARELGKKILVIDTENKTSSKYAKILGPFDILPLQNYSLQNYISVLEFVTKKNYDVVIVDSLSHAWAGKGGAIEQVDQGKAKYHGNKLAAWADVTPLQNRLVDTILSYPIHLIATMRMKADYILTTDDNGKQKPVKVGMGIVQRDSLEYEFDIIAQMDTDHNLTVTKTRCFELDGFMAHKPDGTMGKMIADWLSDGQAIPPVEPTYEPIESAKPPKTSIDDAIDREFDRLVATPLTKRAPTMPPNSPQGLVDVVNDKLGQVYYNAPNHAYNALKKYLGKFSWPGPIDVVGWQKATESALLYAREQLLADLAIKEGEAQ